VGRETCLECLENVVFQSVKGKFRLTSTEVELQLKGCKVKFSHHTLDKDFKAKVHTIGYLSAANKYR
jgi:hypothetical protein